MGLCCQFGVASPSAYLQVPCMLPRKDCTCLKSYLLPRGGSAVSQIPSQRIFLFCTHATGFSGGAISIFCAQAAAHSNTSSSTRHGPYYVAYSDSTPAIVRGGLCYFYFMLLFAADVPGAACSVLLCGARALRTVCSPSSGAFPAPWPLSAGAAGVGYGPACLVCVGCIDISLQVCALDS